MKIKLPAMVMREYDLGIKRMITVPAWIGGKQCIKCRKPIGDKGNMVVVEFDGHNGIYHLCCDCADGV